MGLTELGSHAAMLGAPERSRLADELLFGNKNVTDYHTGLCHEVSAFVGYLMNRHILPYQLAEYNSNDWIPVFNFANQGYVWNGKDAFPRGAIIGFQNNHAMHPSGIVHSATATGVGCHTRGVNSYIWNPNHWTGTSDVQAICGHRNEDGTFTVDGYQYTIYVLPLEY